MSVPIRAGVAADVLLPIPLLLLFGLSGEVRGALADLMAQLAGARAAVATR